MRPTFSLDLQSAGSQASVFIDTPIPGFKEVEAAKASSSYNYFSSNPVGIESGGGGSAGGGAGEGSGGQDGDGSPVHDLFFEEDEVLRYLEKIPIFRCGST